MVNWEYLLKYKLERLEHQKDLYWKQRAHVNWMEKGDKNTPYFQAYASARKKTNRLNKLKKDNGEVVQEEAEMAAVITNYFCSLFTS